MHKEKQVLGVLCSGRGTDLQSIIDAIGRGEVDATIGIVLTDKSDAYALERAKKAGINIHPALLPSFPGAHAHRDVLAYGVKVSGCTVHFVDEGTDSGPIILQRAVPVLDGDTEETLGARVLEQEHIIYPQAVQLFCEGRLQVEGRHVHILPAQDAK